jgi:hypothetical protein
MPNSQDEQQIQALGQRILLACANKLGGVEPLARYLQASEEQVREWLVGRTVPPAALVMRAIDPVLGDPATPWRDPRAGDSEAHKLQ